MFSLVRSGPKILLLESSNLNTLKEHLINNLNATESNVDVALNKSGEGVLLIFLVKSIKDIVQKDDISFVFISKMQPDSLLCHLIGENMTNLISCARMAPRIIVMRTLGNMDKVIDEIQQDYHGISGEFENIMETFNDKGTVVVFSQNPLNNNMKLLDIYPRALFIKKEYHPLLRELRMHALKYLNEGLGNKDWYEIEIRIYDRYSQYDLHYKRLLKILEMLELGVILGESWGKDSPRFLMTVGVYRMKFFTVHSPTYIKKLLTGLEHLPNGARIVDYDVYYHRKKISWTDIMEKDCKTRHLISKKYREEIFSKLSDMEKEGILNVEKQLK